MGVGGQHHALAALPLGRRPGAHCTEGWVAPIVDPDNYEKSCLQQDSIPGLSSP